MNYASSYSRQVTKEAEKMMQDNGLLLNGMDVYNSLATLTGAAVKEANAVLGKVNTANPGQIPKYSSSGFNPPKNMNATISAAMGDVREIQAHLAADPTWKGNPTAATLREEKQLELMEKQNILLEGLNVNMQALANNTTGLTDTLNTIATSQAAELDTLNNMSDKQTTELNSLNSTNNLFTTLLNKVTTIQDWLLKMEQQMATQADAAAAAVQAANAAATAAENAATAAGSAATAAEATTTVVTAATTPPPVAPATTPPVTPTTTV